MTKTCISILFVFTLTFTSFGHTELPSNFFYERTTGQKTGKPIYEVRAHSDAIEYDMQEGNTFEALGAIAQPDREKYGLVFTNAKKAYQFRANKNKSCTLTVDKEIFRFPKYLYSGGFTAGSLKLETVTIPVPKAVFEKTMNGSDITIRCGIVFYNLDQDNIDAFRYLAQEMEKDIKRRNQN